jgi:hypothetical protein
MAWTTPTTQVARTLITDTIWNRDIVDNLNYLYNNLVHYPLRATMWHDESLVTVGNAISRSVTTTQPYNLRVFQNSGANGDTFTNGFLLKAGTYTLAVLGETSTDRGLIDWYIDNAKVVSLQDWYAGSTAQNIEKIASVTVTGEGYHVLKGVINGKNASSSGYNMVLTKMYLKPAADTEDHT